MLWISFFGLFSNKKKPLTTTWEQDFRVYTSASTYENSLENVGQGIMGCKNVHLVRIPEGDDSKWFWSCNLTSSNMWYDYDELMFKIKPAGYSVFTPGLTNFYSSFRDTQKYCINPYVKLDEDLNYKWFCEGSITAPEKVLTKKSDLDSIIYKLFTNPFGEYNTIQYLTSTFESKESLDGDIKALLTDDTSNTHDGLLNGMDDIVEDLVKQTNTKFYKIISQLQGKNELDGEIGQLIKTPLSATDNELKSYLFNYKMENLDTDIKGIITGNSDTKTYLETTYLKLGDLESQVNILLGNDGSLITNKVKEVVNGVLITSGIKTDIGDIKKDIVSINKDIADLKKAIEDLKVQIEDNEIVGNKIEL